MNDVILLFKNKQNKQNKKLLTYIQNLSPAAREQEIDYDNKKYTLLSLSILFNNDFILNKLLDLDVDPNSNKYPNGIPYISPISLCESISQIDTLILHGGNINGYGLDQETLLTRLISKSIQKSKYVKLIEYILSKGAKVNFPLFNLPLNKFINTYKNTKGRISYKHINTITELLLSYFANPEQKEMSGEKSLSCQEIKLTPSKRKHVNNIYLSFRELLDNKKNKIIIDHVSDILKIKCKNKWECIQYILKHKDEIDYNDISNRRNKLDCSNDTTFSFNSLNEYSKSEIYVYTDSRGLKWCFHMSELENIIVTRKNPWTNVSIPNIEISNIFSHLKYIPEYTLEEATTEIFERDTVNINNDKRLSHLSNLIESVNTYVGSGLQQNISQLPDIEILEIFRLINGYGISFNYDIIYNVYISRNRESLIHHLYDLIVEKLQENQLTLHILSIILDQIFKDYDVLENFIKIIGDKEIIKSYFDYYSQPLTSYWLAGDRDTIKENNLITHTYSGGAMLTSDQARNISQMIEIRIGNNTPESIDNYWREFYEVLKRNLLTKI